MTTDLPFWKSIFPNQCRFLEVFGVWILLKVTILEVNCQAQDVILHVKIVTYVKYQNQSTLAHYNGKCLI